MRPPHDVIDFCPDIAQLRHKIIASPRSRCRKMDAKPICQNYSERSTDGLLRGVSSDAPCQLSLCASAARWCKGHLEIEPSPSLDSLHCIFLASWT